MSELFPFLPAPTKKDQEHFSDKYKKMHPPIKSHYKCLIFFQQDKNRRKVKLLIITVLSIVLIHIIPKYFTITKRYNRNSYYLHYKKKYDRCQFDPEGPVPAILMALGRSGSSVTWDTLSRLAGDGEPTISHEVTGGNKEKSIAFFDQIEDHINERWASLRLCNIQRYYRDKSKGNKNRYSLVGFQWKPYLATFDHHYAVDGLRRVADDGLKVIYLTRNPLDRYISNQRHKGFIHSDEIPAHCDVNDIDCVERHKKHSKGITINVKDEERKHKFIASLENSLRADVMIEDRLNDLNVTYVHVTYEKLFDGDAEATDEADEWKRILTFLGLSKEGLTIGDARATFQLASTSTNKHSLSIANFEEVASLLKDTKYEKLLH